MACGTATPAGVCTQPLGHGNRHHVLPTQHPMCPPPTGPTTHAFTFCVRGQRTLDMEIQGVQRHLHVPPAVARRRWLHTARRRCRGFRTCNQRCPHQTGGWGRITTLRHRASPATQSPHVRVQTIQTLARYTDRTHVHTRHVDTCHRSHTCAQETYRCSPATKITHMRERQTLARHTDHTHALKCHTDVCKTYRRSPATNISHTHARHTDALQQQRSHMHARHTDTRQPHKSHTRTCETYTHQPCGSHTHTPAHTSPAWSHFHSGSPGMGQPRQGEQRHRHMKTPFSTTS